MYDCSCYGEIRIQHLLSAFIRENRLVRLVKDRASLELTYLYNKLTRKAAIYLERKEFEKSLYAFVLAYSLFKEVRLEKVKGEPVESSIPTFRKGKELLSVIVKESENTNQISVKLNNSLLFYALLGMAECFNNMLNFKESQDCLNEAESIQTENSYLAFLNSQNCGFNCKGEQEYLSKASAQLKRAKRLFDSESFYRNPEPLLRTFQLKDFNKSIKRQHKYLVKKKKAFEKKTRLKTNQLCYSAFEKMKQPVEVPSNLKQLKTKLENLRYLSELIHSAFIKNLRFYRENRNDKHFNRVKKEYYLFIAFKEEIDFFDKIKINLKQLSPRSKNKLLDIYSNKKQKELFMDCFEMVRLETMIDLDKRFRESEGAKTIKDRDKMGKALSMLKETYNSSAGKKEKAFNLTLRDCSFLLSLGIIIAKFLNLIIIKL